MLKGSHFSEEQHKYQASHPTRNQLLDPVTELLDMYASPGWHSTAHSATTGFITLHTAPSLFICAYYHIL
ncbi:hypothetical protein Mapa_014077 [Marchantia paleacea]|nr:hypothetical protein Mapa_014077 [Marchantia paleacea]